MNEVWPRDEAPVLVHGAKYLQPCALLLAYDQHYKNLRESWCVIQAACELTGQHCLERREVEYLDEAVLSAGERQNQPQAKLESRRFRELRWGVSSLRSLRLAWATEQTPLISGGERARAKVR